jgi:hypothetical protein
MIAIALPLRVARHLNKSPITPIRTEKAIAPFDPMRNVVESVKTAE